MLMWFSLQEDKKAALEQQYEAFEQYIQNLQAGGWDSFNPSHQSDI